MVGIFVGSDGPAFKYQAPKESSRARVCQYFRGHPGIGFGGGGSTDRSCCDRCVAAQSEFAVEKALETAQIHYNQDEIDGLRSDLQPKASALELQHRGGAPGSFTSIRPAGDNSLAVIRSDNKSPL